MSIELCSGGAGRLSTDLVILALAPILAPWATLVAAAAEPGPGLCRGANGSLVMRASPEQAWRAVKQGDSLPAEALLLAVPFSELDLSGGKVQMRLLADLDGRGPHPIIDTAVILHENRKADADFTLDRGRVSITNKRADMMPATVIARFRDQAWTFRLLEPGTTVALEIYGRWPQGVPFTPTPTEKDVPVLDAIALTISGQAQLSFGDRLYLLKSPPGRALFRWDSVHGPETAPENLREIPEWARDVDPATIPDLQQRKAAVARFRQLLLEKSVDAALDEFSASEDPRRRRFAIYAMGALDMLPRLGRMLTESKHADDWDNAVTAARHWLGRGPGQDLKMYQTLIKERNATPEQAAIVLQLLHRFSEEECCQPELYELLIEYLRNDLFPVRGLAHWHLKRLAPAGKKIAYNPGGTKDEIERGYQEWKKLIPTGKVPPGHTKPK